MTVGILYKVSGLGAVLGCDSRVTGGTGQILSDQDEKWLVGGNIVSCCAGSLGGLWHDLRAQPPKTFAEFRLKTTDIDAVSAHDRDYELLVYDRKHDVIWHTDHSGEALKRGVFAAIGCGNAYAIGALSTSEQPKTLEQAEKLVRRALKVACSHHSACGGRLRTIVIEGKRGPVTVR